VWVIGEQVETGRRDKTGQRDESRPGEGHHRLYHIADANEKRGVGRMA
jgi:hypothetical protein